MRADTIAYPPQPKQVFSSILAAQDQKAYPGIQEENADEEYFNQRQDGLLSLILGVQSYLSEVSKSQPGEHNSPLFDLQHKMFMYLKQRDFQVELDFSTV
ncbi:hypothetical protein J3Q64DRAFT_1707738 [Phycomyces blakesleeanus]|uniref:Uncharacterized protein n=2 Tax=Phycomyces blakesleeanus TaxID=4837 RepID=A0A167P888_PHYB8|nr:hypothetical protein PHYBLDRAFT_141340 [Phycomyces blakesleeanus NRRL 1555(-)]OAD77451.1 hypothetical protein PHYBLDRAFT_141340 [Phycomyces blakesleeanus NRRL 1555(-)]|eukprot:XP_018295491.1 hypothetical protein PHYBLDRAFT_141340 [Phycomyces blakesleeanus NRRL 1555(-)]